VTRVVSGTPRYLDPQKSEAIKLDRGDYVGDFTPHENFRISNLKDIMVSNKLICKKFTS